MNGKLVLEGELVKMSDEKSLKVGFEYRPYAGFGESLYSKAWSWSKFIEISELGKYNVELENLNKEATYEFRAVVVHPKMTIYGDVLSTSAGNS